VTKPDDVPARGARRAPSSAVAARLAPPAEHSLVPENAYWVSSAAVRQALGAWAYTRGAGEARPSAPEVRTAVAVASAIVERAARPLLTSGGEPLTAPGSWRAEVPEDVADLAARAGVSPQDATKALELLAAAGVVERRSGAGAAVRLSEAVMAAAPATAQMEWDGVRERLNEAGASLPPALAVLRELACAVGAIADPLDSPSVRASVRDLEDRTAFGRSTVAEGLAALERAGVLAIETRAGRTTRFTLSPAAFGLAPTSPANPMPRGRSRTLRSTPDGPKVRSRAPLTSDPRAGVGNERAAPHAGARSAGAAVLLGVFAGTPIHAPPGTPLIVECDELGQWTCRVGPFLRLGPAAGPP
jgi:DNA-binding transcriptional regulator YhcF (GntR family)